MNRARSLKNLFLTLPLSLGLPVVGTAVTGVLLLAPQSAQAAENGSISESPCFTCSRA